MLDPLSALNVATAVVQFVDSGSRLIDLAYEIYNSKDGAVEEHLEIEKVTALLKSLNDADLKRLDDELGRSFDAKTRDWTTSERQLQSLAYDCSRLANELLGLLGELREQTSRCKSWGALKQAVKSMRKRRDVENLQKRLAEIRSQVSFHLLHSLRYANTQCLTSEPMVGS